MKTFIEILNEENKSWAGVKITEGIGKLTELFNEYKTDEMKDWTNQDYHMTIGMSGMPEKLKDREGETIELTVTHVGWSDKAFGVKVSGQLTSYVERAVPHITIRYPQHGGKGGFFTGTIRTWKDIPNFKVKGILKTGL
jgi:hypothetical protein